MDANGRVCGSLVRVRVVRVPAREAILGDEQKRRPNERRRRRKRPTTRGEETRADDARDIEINHGESGTI